MGNLGDSVLILKFGCKNEGKEPGRRSFKTTTLEFTYERGRKRYDNKRNDEPRRTETRSWPSGCWRNTVGLLTPGAWKFVPSQPAQNSVI